VVPSIPFAISPKFPKLFNWLRPSETETETVVDRVLSKNHCTLKVRQKVWISLFKLRSPTISTVNCKKIQIGHITSNYQLRLNTSYMKLFDNCGPKLLAIRCIRILSFQFIFFFRVIYQIQKEAKHQDKVYKVQATGFRGNLCNLDNRPVSWDITLLKLFWSLKETKELAVNQQNRNFIKK
jgi:hypothetical protein